MPNDLEGIVACISPGCDQTILFKLDLHARFRIPSIIIDKAEAKPEITIEPHEYIEKWIGPKDSSDTTSISSLTRLKPDGDLLLQIDIEGAEYKSLLTTSPDVLDRFRIIITEFHQLSEIKIRHFLNMLPTKFLRKLQQVMYLYMNTQIIARKVGRTERFSFQK